MDARLEFFLKVYLYINIWLLKIPAAGRELIMHEKSLHISIITRKLYFRHVLVLSAEETTSQPNRTLTLKGLPMVGILGLMSLTGDNCTCWQINYLRYGTFQHMNGFLIRNDSFHFSRSYCGLFSRIGTIWLFCFAVKYAQFKAINCKIMCIAVLSNTTISNTTIMIVKIKKPENLRLTVFSIGDHGF